jgi:hypothetical protein
VRQAGGPGLYAAAVHRPAPAKDAVTDAAGDGTYDAGGQSSSNMPNLDITGSSLALLKAKSCHAGGDTPVPRRAAARFRRLSRSGVARAVA